MRNEYQPRLWRGVYDIITCWLVIAFAIWLTVSISPWLYPLSLILIANRYLALSLICHEGLHGNISRNRLWNDFLARYFCAYPTFISFSRPVKNLASGQFFRPARLPAPSAIEIFLNFRFILDLI